MSDVHDGIVHKDRPNARVARQAEPKPERVRGPVFEKRANGNTIVERASDGGPPVGSIDLRTLNYSATEPWLVATRLCDVVATVEAGLRGWAREVSEMFNDNNKRISKEFDKTDAKIEKLEARTAALETENLSLRSLTAELQGEVADCHHQLELQRASCGNGDGRSLPTSITQPRIKQAKRKRAAGATAEAPR
jgi:hypothetical protein